MDKYYKEEELMQRTSKNDFLYDELYKEKQIPSSNVTVLDNINEIDITKIKAMVDKRENYKKVKDYNSIVNDLDNYKKEEVKYDFEEIDEADYDINEILKKKRSNIENTNKIRKISGEDYELMTSLETSEEENDNIDLTGHEKQLKDLYDTITKAIDDDLFANLKEDKEEVEEKTEEETVDNENESSFYTSTSKIDAKDFGEDEEKNGSTLFIVIAIIAILVAVGIVVYLKFFN